MITAIISFSSNQLDYMAESGSQVSIDEKIEGFSFLQIVRKFRSGKVVKVRTEVSSIDEIRDRIGNQFVVEEPSQMNPL